MGEDTTNEYCKKRTSQYLATDVLVVNRIQLGLVTNPGSLKKYL